MRPDPQVIEELRTLFIEGSTPSRLIQHIVARHENEKKLYTLIQLYFREAFLTPLLHVNPEVMLNDPGGLGLAFLNVNLVHQMLLARSEWDKERSSTSLPADWLGGFQVRSDADLISDAKPEMIPELGKSWGVLDDDAKRYIQRAFGNAQALHERVLLLARLAEQLQQQVNALQNERRRRDEADTAILHTPQA
jgi:hypothetical protein